MIGWLCGALVGIVLVLRFVHHKHVVAVITARGLSLDKLFRGYRVRLAFLRIPLLILLSLIMIGIYEGFWALRSQQERTIERRDCIIAIDVSQSMRAREDGFSRLEIARKKVAELLAARAADRYALYVFAGDAVVLAPLTADIACIELFLNDIDDRMIAASTTSLAALLKAIIEHDASDTLAAQRSVVILSDGEDFSENLEELISEASSRGIRVISWAIGSESGAPIPIYDERGNGKGHLKASDGTVVISRREDRALKYLAEKTGGIFIEQTPDSTDCKKVIASLVPQKTTDREETIVSKTPARVLWIAFAIAALEWMISA